MTKNTLGKVAIALGLYMVMPVVMAADNNRDVEQIKRDVDKLSRTVEQLRRENDKQKESLRKLECQNKRMREVQTRLLKEMADFVVAVKNGQPQKMPPSLETHLRQADTDMKLGGC